MTYLLERFGTLVLPTAKPRSTAGVGPAISALTDVVGGAYDSWGSNQAPVGTQTITHTAIITGSSFTSVDAQYATLRGMIGKRDRLYRRHPDNSLEWIYARLTNVTADRQSGQIYHFEVNMTFEVANYPWNGYLRGYQWSLDTGLFFDAGLIFDGVTSYVIPQSGTIVFSGVGNYPVKNPVITIYAGGTTVTGLTMSDSVSGYSLAYGGTVAAGGTLIIDCGAYTVYNGTTDHYAYLTRGSAHVIPEWVSIPAGGTMTITKTEAGTVTTGIFRYYDGWA
jgi:hypothetical protein